MNKEILRSRKKSRFQGDNLAQFSRIDDRVQHNAYQQMSKRTTVTLALSEKNPAGVSFPKGVLVLSVGSLASEQLPQPR